MSRMTLNPATIVGLAHDQEWTRIHCLRIASEALRAAGHRIDKHDQDDPHDLEVGVVHELLQRLGDRLGALAHGEVGARPSLAEAYDDAAGKVADASAFIQDYRIGAA